MGYLLAITEDADRQLRAFDVYEQRIIEAGMMSRLVHQPTKECRAIKRLRPNPFAEFELRLGDYRVLYNIEEEPSKVVIKAIGRKVGSRLVLEGEEFHEHQSDQPEGTNGES